MNSYDLIFTVNQTEKIIAQLKDPLCYIGWSEIEPIFFMRDNISVMLADGPIYFNIRDLRDILKKVLTHQLIIDNSISLDIGYLCNEYNENENGFLIELFESGSKLWIGYRYYLWETCDNEKKYVTWMYNDHQNNIVLTITPLYPYRYCDKEKQANYTTYKKWIKTYTPYLITTLSKQTAQQWLDQAEHIVKTVDDNIERWEKKEK